MDLAHTHFVPPRPAPPAENLSFLGFLRAIRANMLDVWPKDAYEQDTLRRDVLGRTMRLVNAMVGATP
jgi:hypothetical protein